MNSEIKIIHPAPDTLASDLTAPTTEPRIEIGGDALREAGALDWKLSEATKNELREIDTAIITAVPRIAALATPPDARPVGDDALREAAGFAAMYLRSGFINCDRCGHEVSTDKTDALYELDRALAASQTQEGTGQETGETQPISEAMQGYLRVCACGGMPKELREQVQTAVEQAERLGYFAFATPAPQANDGEAR